MRVGALALYSSLDSEMIVHGTSRMFVPVVTAVILTAADARAQASRPEGLARTDSQSASVPVSTLFTGDSWSHPATRCLLASRSASASDVTLRQFVRLTQLIARHQYAAR
jgi:hypothetical protein